MDIYIQIKSQARGLTTFGDTRYSRFIDASSSYELASDSDLDESRARDVKADYTGDVKAKSSDVMAPSSDVMVEADNVNIHSSNVKVEAKDVKQEDTKQDLILSTSLSPR